MNVYDFDNTIYRPDSSHAFCMYCFRRFPRIMLQDVVLNFRPLVQFLTGANKDAAPLKERIFSFLKYIPDVDAVVEDFWNENFSGFQQWYLDQKQNDDVIISASPEFLLKPAAERLGFHLIATNMDKYSGRILGRNCHDEQKLVRFREEYPWAEVDNFYSDSLSDAPMADIAAHAFLVKKWIPTPWPEKE